MIVILFIICILWPSEKDPSLASFILPSIKLQGAVQIFWELLTERGQNMAIGDAGMGLAT